MLSRQQLGHHLTPPLTSTISVFYHHTCHDQLMAVSLPPPRGAGAKFIQLPSLLLPSNKAVLTQSPFLLKVRLSPAPVPSPPSPWRSVGWRRPHMPRAAHSAAAWAAVHGQRSSRGWGSPWSTTWLPPPAWPRPPSLAFSSWPGLSLSSWPGLAAGNPAFAGGVGWVPNTRFIGAVGAAWGQWAGEVAVMPSCSPGRR